MAAVRGGHVAAVAALLKAGASPLQENYAGTNALSLAQVWPGACSSEDHCAV